MNLISPSSQSGITWTEAEKNFSKMLWTNLEKCVLMPKGGSHKILIWFNKNVNWYILKHLCLHCLKLFVFCRYIVPNILEKLSQFKNARFLNHILYFQGSCVELQCSYAIQCSKGVLRDFLVCFLTVLCSNNQIQCEPTDLGYENVFAVLYSHFIACWVGCRSRYTLACSLCDVLAISFCTWLQC